MEIVGEGAGDEEPWRGFCRTSSRWRLQWTGSARYGEYLSSVKMTGRRLPRSVGGGPRDGGYGARWPSYLGPNRLIERTREQQREVRRLTEGWLVDEDVRKGRSAVGSSAWRRKSSRGSVQRRVHREEARVAW